MARVRRLVAEHEESLAAEKAGAPRKTEGTTPLKPKAAHAAKRGAEPARRVGLVWRVTLVWPPELVASSPDVLVQAPSSR